MGGTEIKLLTRCRMHLIIVFAIKTQRQLQNLANNNNNVVQNHIIFLNLLKVFFVHQNYSKVLINAVIIISNLQSNKIKRRKNKQRIIICWYTLTCPLCGYRICSLLLCKWISSVFFLHMTFFFSAIKSNSLDYTNEQDVPTVTLIQRFFFVFISIAVYHTPDFCIHAANTVFAVECIC